MGFQMTAFFQKRSANGSWENVPSIDGEPHPDDGVTVIRDDIHSYQHWEWFGLGEAYADGTDDSIRHSLPKGLPDDLSQVQRDDLEFACDYAFNWHMIDDLINTDWDVEVPRINKTLREHLGQPFIDWLTRLKNQGVERIVYAF